MTDRRRLIRRLLRYAIGLAGIITLIVAISWFAFPKRVTVSEPFALQTFDINTLDYYDLGVIDLDRDGRLDLYTTNHSSRQSLLRSLGNWQFADVLTDVGMDQIADLPGAEDFGVAPRMDEPGLYVYYIGSTLFLDYRPIDGNPELSGKISVIGGTDIQQREGFRASVSAAGSDAAAHVDFSTTAAGRIAVSVIRSAPTIVRIDGNFPREFIRVGQNRITPVDHQFELLLKDRHGIAWADINRDSVPDAFMSRGAIFGTAADIPAELGDQLYVSAARDEYEEKARELGFVKRHCPARQVAWTDVNDDGLLDLYVACGRQVGGFWEYVPVALRRDRAEAPNMLFVQDGSGQFTERAAEFGIDFSVGGTFLWLDIDSDADADLVWASENEIALYRNTNGELNRELLLPGATTIQVRRLIADDFDNDADIDLLAVAALGSQILLNDQGTLAAHPATEFGLPSGMRTAAWVDVDNDGRTELYTWPDGLFRLGPDGQFTATGLLDIPSPWWPLVDPRVAWFDADNDGDRDLLVMQRFFPQVLQRTFPEAMPFSADFLRNEQDSDNNWFQVELRGSTVNTAAIGAQVLVTTTAGTKLAEAGQSDTSHYSQGHYRLYFGIGKDDEPADVLVRWPDGELQQVDGPFAGRILRVEKMPVNAESSPRER